MKTFKPNQNLEREVRDAPETRAVLAAAANLARTQSERLAHHAMPRKGAASPIVVMVDGEGAYVVNTNHGGVIEEWGSVNSPAYAPLRRGVTAAGFRLSSPEG